jgi:hypothetical protein
MQRRELIAKIQEPPPLRVGKRLQAILDAPEYSEPGEMPCASPDCFNFFVPTARRRRYCSSVCAGRAVYQANAKRAGKVAGDKRRGSNPNRHIQVRIDGKLVYLHRHIVERCLGVKLAPDEIVHHRDNDKHHNHYWKNAAGCERCEAEGQPNLELLTGDAAREHIERHRAQLVAARKQKRQG